MEYKRVDSDQRLNFINDLDDKLLLGGVILSGWSSFIIEQADLAFISGNDLASILTAIAGIEAHLRYEAQESSHKNLRDLIDESGLTQDVIDDLHTIRKYRNSWVHIKDTTNDNEIINTPEVYEKELEKMAILTIQTLRKTIYSNLWV